ncbi:hypothetical protein TNIN_237541 [Trichonephila inaurata madagascariensis]|uniref:Uncharacterized protein n=1 Tax=Trichonephila inaurata madagascariensis TaxID=2747483 RepID=A0A8X7BTI2_9ARAC|nr:hypothetical protein TNIN_237541 [Trichonephila inaurata madagascariensis]
MKDIIIDIYFIWLSGFAIVEKNQKKFLLLKKLIKIKNDQSDHESDAIDIEQCDNEIESEQEVNKIEFSSSEDEDLRCIAPSKKRTRVIISNFITESDLDAIDASSDKRN